MEIYLGIIGCVDPLIALLMCAIEDDVWTLNKCHKEIFQLALGLALLLSILIPLILTIQSR